MWQMQPLASLNAPLSMVKGNALLVGFFYSQCLSPRKNSRSLPALYRSSICRASAARRPGADQSRLVVTAIDLAVAAALGVLVWNLALGGK